MPDANMNPDKARPTVQRRLCLQRMLAVAALPLWPLSDTRAAQAAPGTDPVAAPQSLRKPVDTVVLTVSGQVRQPNVGGKALFDMPMLAALPQVSHLTATPWYQVPRTFTGPLLRDVLTRCSAQGETLRLSALNDFRMDMPMSDPQKHDVILARLLDGKPMSVRDKGPLFVIYPFSEHAELRSMVYYVRSLWQLNAIEVL